MTTNPHDPTDPWARALRTAMSPARDLEPTDAEVQRALAAGDARPAPRHRLVPRLAIAAVAAAILGSGLYAVPATRAAVDDLYGTLSEWVSGDGSSAPVERSHPGTRPPSGSRPSTGRSA